MAIGRYALLVWVLDINAIIHPNRHICSMSMTMTEANRPKSVIQTYMGHL